MTDDLDAWGEPIPDDEGYEDGDWGLCSRCRAKLKKHDCDDLCSDCRDDDREDWEE